LSYTLKVSRTVFFFFSFFGIFSVCDVQTAEEYIDQRDSINTGYVLPSILNSMYQQGLSVDTEIADSSTGTLDHVAIASESHFDFTRSQFGNNRGTIVLDSSNLYPTTTHSLSIYSCRHLPQRGSLEKQFKNTSSFEFGTQ